MKLIEAEKYDLAIALIMAFLGTWAVIVKSYFERQRTLMINNDA